MQKSASSPAAICSTIAASVFVILFGLGPAAAKGNINTYKFWNGTEREEDFGCPNSTTYGQVITIPKKMHTLNKFSFWWGNDFSSGTMVVRGEVYLWDGTKAAGEALYESKPRTISFQGGDFHAESFKPAVLPVVPGAQYVVFASIDKDFEKCTEGYALAWGAVADNTYSGGSFVYQNNGGDEGQWTTTPWDTDDFDLAIKVSLNP